MKKPSLDGLRNAVKLFKVAEPTLDILFFLAFSGMMYSFLPSELFYSYLPATGGDMGSHYWPLHVLFNYGLEEGTFKIWNPGNLTGEPLLVHYFPLPFLIMIFLGFFIPLGMAFNIGSILPLLLLPFSAYFCSRLMGLRFPAPILGAAATLPFIFNESNSMWGGNTLSTMAGQFAHAYALVFMLLAIGFLFYETKTNKFPIFSGLMFGAVALSHAYVLLGVPVFIIVYLFSPSRHSFLLYRLKKAFLSGLIALTFSFWFLIPMIDNSRWNTAFAFPWLSKNIWKEIIPIIFYPTIVALVFCTLVFLLAIIYNSVGRSSRLCKAISSNICLLLIWAVPAFFYVVMFHLFPKIGLVDVRAVPQSQLYFSVLAGSWLGFQLRNMGRIPAWIVTGSILISSIYWSQSYVKNFPHWAKYNYSGWQGQSGYRDLKDLTNHVKGDFSDPRIIFEHNDINKYAGTTRVFEMLPYFAGRSTLESVYLQASIVSPSLFYAQALVSKTPSCPFPNFKCKGSIQTIDEVKDLVDKLDLLGVKGAILHSPEIRELSVKSNLFTEEVSFGPWFYSELKKDISLVEIIDEPLKLLKEELDWKIQFYDWFKDYREGDRFLLSLFKNKSEASMVLDINKSHWGKANSSHCRPSVEVGFNRINLKTNCPNKLHLLKFSYHPSWDGDFDGEIFNVSPGFMALIPGKTDLELKFGQSLLWSVSNLVSIIGIIVILIFLVQRNLKDKFTK